MTGLIILNKHEGISSFRAVSIVRGITGEKRVGHTGTLDPMATGVLPVMLGGATKFCEFLPSHDKSYRAKLLLGVTTDTLDITGNVLTQRSVDVAAGEFKSALARFTGEIEQLPPMFSAVSKDGVRLYKLARQGIVTEREKRQVTVFFAETVCENEQKGEYTIDVVCSAGTYIRTLINDIGEVLGCGAVMTALCRTRSNGFFLQDALTITELEELARQGRAGEAVIPIEKALSQYQNTEVSERQAIRFKNGGPLDLCRLKDDILPGLTKVFSPNGDFLGLGEKNEETGELTPKRILAVK